MIEHLQDLSRLRMKHRSVLAGRGMNQCQVFLVGSLLTFSALTSAIAADMQTFEAETAESVGGASKVADGGASQNASVGLSKADDGIKFTGLPAAGKLAIRYASTNVGTISVAVNDQPARKVNIHSSGALTNSFLNAIIELTIPANATLMVTVACAGIASSIIALRNEFVNAPDEWTFTLRAG